MNNINSGVNGCRLISSFNLGGQNSGAYHIYDNHGECKQVSENTYNSFNSNYKSNKSNNKR
jgi:hypothetical protein